MGIGIGTSGMERSVVLSNINGGECKNDNLPRVLKFQAMALREIDGVCSLQIDPGILTIDILISNI
jgi:hypothetical protein